MSNPETQWCENCTIENPCTLHAHADELLDALRMFVGTLSDEDLEEHDDIGAQGHDPDTCALCSARLAIANATEGE